MIMEQKLYAACVTLAVLAFAMAMPQGTALARGGMEVRTADLCLTGYQDSLEDSGGIGTVAAVTDNRSRLTMRVTAWAVSLEGMLPNAWYYVYDTGQNPGGPNCEEGEFEGSFFVYPIPTNENGEAFQNTFSVIPTNNPDVGDVIQICRYDGGGLIPILEGVLVKGGKEKNKPNRCPPD